ncbi:hypothetical protein FOZ62_027947 [Perkinsus olseni]|uniref:Uncharacterized protein n=1 Tax=Perkinsus olseni TaxID=32597 RepID=A0A7J6R2S3_PEROL|nr:hypothetical protein FOZ62_027947 [Perkinsus olseni]
MFSVLSYPKSMVDLGPVPQDSLQIPAGLHVRHAASSEIGSKIPRPTPTVALAESHQSNLNGSQRAKSSALFSGNNEEKREPLGKDVGGSAINPSMFARLDETPAESGARAVLAKSGGIPHAKETASGESPVTSRMATGVLKSSAGSVGHSTTTSAVLKRVVGAESSSEDEGETTHAATKGIHGRSAKPKPAGLEKLLGSVASSKPVVITEGDDEFEI